MYKACSRCGRIHDSNFKCRAGIDYSRDDITEERRLRNKTAWANKSAEIRERAQYICEVCRDRGIYNYRDLEVHHIVKLRDSAEGLLDNYNLVCLCAKHHRQADKGQLDAEYLRNLAKNREEKR